MDSKIHKRVSPYRKAGYDVRIIDVDNGKDVRLYEIKVKLFQSEPVPTMVYFLILKKLNLIADIIQPLIHLQF